MAELDEKKLERRERRIEGVVNSAPWVRIMRVVIAAIAVFLLFHAAKQFMAGKLLPIDAWIVVMAAALGLSGLVEAIWPKGDHRLLQFWTFTVVAASAIAAWAVGAPRWIGVAGLILMALSFARAVASSAGRLNSDAS